MKYQKSLNCFLLLILFISAFSNPAYAELNQNEYFIISYDKSDEKIAQDILQNFSKIVPEMNREVGFYDMPIIQLVLTHSKKEFNKYVTLGKLPENSIAMAIPTLSKIILQNPKTLPHHTEFYKVLTHEYLHIMLHSIAPNVYLPLWFEEGFVQYYAKEWNINREVRFVTDALKGNVLDLQSYSYHYPKVQMKVDIFYLQSYYTFRYLLKRFDTQEYYQFIDHIRAGQNFETSFTRAFGMSVNSFLDTARKSISSHTIFAILYSGFGLFWTIIPILLLIAYIRKRRYRRGLEDKCETEELWQDSQDEG